MAAETQYTANTGMVTISTANSNLDGTGTLGTVLTAASNGTLVKTISIQATGNTSQGMIRFFLDDGTNKRLLDEIPVSAVTRSSTDLAFNFIFNPNYMLKSGWILKASTEVGESFNIIAQGADWAYYGSSVRPESTWYTAKTGMTLISTANTNLDGTGTLGTLITAASGTSSSGNTWKGCKVEKLLINATVSTTHGMVRVFLHDGTNTKLFLEKNVPANTKSATVRSFKAEVPMNFELKAGWSIKVSTEKAESFSVIAEGLDWEYPA